MLFTHNRSRDSLSHLIFSAWTCLFDLLNCELWRLQIYFFLCEKFIWKSLFYVFFSACDQWTEQESKSLFLFVFIWMYPLILKYRSFLFNDLVEFLYHIHFGIINIFTNMSNKSLGWILFWNIFNDCFF